MALESRLGSRIVLGCSTAWALGGEGCYVGKGKNFRAPLAPPYVWPAAIHPW